MKKAELVFIPSPGIGHLVSAVEMAKHLVERDDRLTITVLIMKLPFDSKARNYTESSLASNRINFIHLPNPESDRTNIIPPSNFVLPFINAHKPHVKEAVSKLIMTAHRSDDENSPKLAGFVLDMFCSEMMDIANDFGVPSYIFFTSSATFLGFISIIPVLHGERKFDPSEFKVSNEEEFPVPALKNPLPAKVLPAFILDRDRLAYFLGFARRLEESKGVLVNTFGELESSAIDSLSKGGIPPVYPVGPVLSLKGDAHDVGSDGDGKYREIMAWLDDQSPASVVFLCFGSMGSFPVNQVKEIACAIEHGGHRFLWSLRQPPPKGKAGGPSDYANLEEVLPDGFSNRTVGVGKVIGWAPQVAVLAHPAIGGFVSHCGWNSTLESTWFGVPVATWPMYAEQQFNAFQMVVELGLATEIKMDYRKENADEMIVSAREIEKGISSVMEQGSERRKRVKETSEMSRKALMEGGSSYNSLVRFVEVVVDNMPR